MMSTRYFVVSIVSLSLLCASCAGICGDSLLPHFSVAPKIFANPNKQAPLAAVLQFDTDAAIETIVEIDDGERQWEIHFDQAHDPAKGLPILGMHPDRHHRIRVAIQTPTSPRVYAPGELTFDTAPLPPGLRDFPPISNTVSKPEQMEAGVTLVSVRRRMPGRAFRMSSKQRKFLTHWGMIVGVDEQGQVVWYYKSDARIAGIERLHNGNLLYTLTDFRAVEIDMLGNKISEWYASDRPRGKPPQDAVPVAVQSIHHQPYELPSGNFLAMTAQARYMENYYTSDTDPDAPRKGQPVMGDEIVEFQPDGKIVWRWNSFDYLDPYRIGYETFSGYWIIRGFPGHIDWTHGNGVSYDSNDDSILISLRLQDAVFKIDRATKEIRWILGEHSDWPEQLQGKLLKPVGKIQWPYHPHNPRVTRSGTVLIYDNGNYGNRPFVGPQLATHQTYSRAVEYMIDEKAMTVEQVWVSENKLSSDSCNAVAMGEAHEMPTTGNILIFAGACVVHRDDLTYDQEGSEPFIGDFPFWSRVQEFTKTDPPELVYELRVEDPDEVLGWTFFGGVRVPTLYPQGTGIEENHKEK